VRRIVLRGTEQALVPALQDLPHLTYRKEEVAAWPRTTR
jgi:hypothetical protein